MVKVQLGLGREPVTCLCVMCHRFHCCVMSFFLNITSRGHLGRNWDTGAYGKHRTKSCKFLVHQQGPLVAEIGTLGLIAAIKPFQNFPDGIRIPGSNRLLESSSKKSHILSCIFFTYFSHNFCGSTIT